MTPKEYAEKNSVAYTTVMYWLKTNRVAGAVKHETPRGPYWELPEDTPRPKKLSGRPKTAAKKDAKKRGGAKK